VQENSNASAINERGDVVGAAETATPYTSHAFLWRHGTMTGLSLLPGVEPGWAFLDPAAISNNGYVAGSGTHGGATRAFLMTLP
jgi:probable HAF family extracellular repeat protein